MILDPFLEKKIIHELNQEFACICRDRQLNLRPTVICLFDSQTLWGQFNGASRTISISRKLVWEYSWKAVTGVLRHEMAHQWVFENAPEYYSSQPHGEMFQKACGLIGVPALFTQSRTGLQEESFDWKQENTESDRLLDKVKRLLALAQSSNEHEAGLAMRKVQALYAQHNLEHSRLKERNQFVHTIISNGKKRRTFWEQTILSILIEYFFVEIVLFQDFNARTGDRTLAFEIIGTRENVMMAEYVYSFLHSQLEILLKQNPDAITPMQKTSYRLGILEGFSKKLSHEEDTRDDTSQLIQKALVEFKNDPVLAGYLKEIYPRLKRKNSKRYVDTEAYKAGQSQGRKLVLHRPIDEKRSGPKLFLR
jgi:hypothetical protein